MKFLTGLILVLFATTSFANISRPSTQEEVRKFCVAIDQALTEESADMALNMEACLETKMKTIGHYVHGTVIRGIVPFRSQARSFFRMSCEGQIKASRISSASVTCE